MSAAMVMDALVHAAGATQAVDNSDVQAGAPEPFSDMVSRIMNGPAADATGPRKRKVKGPSGWTVYTQHRRETATPAIKAMSLGAQSKLFSEGWNAMTPEEQAPFVMKAAALNEQQQSPPTEAKAKRAPKKIVVVDGAGATGAAGDKVRKPRAKKATGTVEAAGTGGAPRRKTQPAKQATDVVVADTQPPAKIPKQVLAIAASMVNLPTVHGEQWYFTNARQAALLTQLEATTPPDDENPQQRTTKIKAQVRQMLREEWKTLTHEQKMPYRDMRFQAEQCLMEAVKQLPRDTQQKLALISRGLSRRRPKFAHHGGPKRPVPAYMLFANEMRPQIKQEFPNSSFSEQGTILGDRWRQMDKTEKQRFLDAAQQDRARYTAAVAAAQGVAV